MIGHIKYVCGDARLWPSSSALTRCRWFRRGWTLQEHIASKSLLFLDASWNPIGSKHEMRDMVSEITRIGVDALASVETLPQITAAKKLSWASGRETTRKVDE